MNTCKKRVRLKYNRETENKDAVDYSRRARQDRI